MEEALLYIISTKWWRYVFTLYDREHFYILVQNDGAMYLHCMTESIGLDNEVTYTLNNIKIFSTHS